VEYLNEKHELAGWAAALYGATVAGLGLELTWQHVSLVLGGLAIALSYRKINAGPFSMGAGDE